MTEVFGFVKENLSGAKRRKSAASGERGAGKGTQSFAPPQHKVARSASSAPSGRMNYVMVLRYLRLDSERNRQAASELAPPSINQAEEEDPLVSDLLETRRLVIQEKSHCSYRRQPLF